MNENKDSSNIDLNKENAQKLSKRSRDYLSGIAGISFYFLTIIFILLAFITCFIIWGINDRKPINFSLVFPFWFIEAYILFRTLFLILNKKKRKLNNYLKKDEEDDLTYESQSGENINKIINISYLLFCIFGWIPILIFCHTILPGHEEEYLGDLFWIGRRNSIGLFSFKGSEYFPILYVIIYGITLPSVWFFKFFKSLFRKPLKNEDQKSLALKQEEEIIEASKNLEGNKEILANKGKEKVFYIENFMLIYQLVSMIGWLPIYLFCHYVLSGHEEEYLGELNKISYLFISNDPDNWFAFFYLICLIIIPLPWYYKLFKALYYKGQKEEKIERSKI